MKKIFAILLALVLTFAMSAVALAVEQTTSIKKTYTLSGDGQSPAETFTFSVTPVGYRDDVDNDWSSTIPDGYVTGNLTIANAVYTTDDGATADGNTKSLNISLPTYNRVGYYKYEVTETSGNTLGVTYNTNQIYLVVSVLVDTESGNLDDPKIVVYAENTAGEKVDTFAQNTYTANKLTIEKTVAGTMADKDGVWHVDVEFTSTTKPEDNQVLYVGTALTWSNTDGVWTAKQENIELKVGTNNIITFTNIPESVTYKVTEKEANENGYTTTYSGATSNDGAASGTMDGTAVAVVINNSKSGNVDTGITMDSIPYVVLLAVAVVGIAALTMKKRYQA